MAVCPVAAATAPKTSGTIDLMIHSYRLRAPIKLEALEFRRVLRHLAEHGWTPAAASAETAFAEALGLPPEAIPDAGLRSSSTNRSADVFHRDGDIYYLIAGHEGAPNSVMTFSFEPDIDTDHKIDVGVVSETQSDIEEKVGALASAVTEAIHVVVDGRRVRHMQLEWSPAVQTGEKIEALCRRVEEGGGEVRFQRPEIDDSLLSAARALQELPSRQLLREINAARFALEQDIRRARKDNSADGALHSLRDNGLLETAYIIQCRETSRPLARVHDLAELDSGSGALPCATCGRTFSDELHLPGFSVTDLGKRLSDHNHWMTVWVTNELLALGVSSDAVLWNLEDSTEELDLIVEFHDELWIIELKDRDFDPRDAHALNYRRVRYKPSKTFVITSGKVAQDARRVFTDLASEANPHNVVFGGRRIPPSAPPGVPIYIEGLDKVRPVLAEELSKASAGFAGKMLTRVASATGLDVIAAINARIRLSHKSG